MSARDLIDAIEEGNAASIQTAFEQEISSRIAERLDAMRQETAKGMFNEAYKASKMSEQDDEEDQEEDKEEDEELEEATQPKSVHPDALHVKHVGGGKYKVHAVGKNFQHGIKTGEHLSDSELDDFSEMGGKVKHMKEDVELDEAAELNEAPSYPYTHHSSTKPSGAYDHIKYHLATHKGDKDGQWHILHHSSLGLRDKVKVLHSGSEDEMKKKFKEYNK